MTDLSVIVPIYNVEPFLAECLDSIINSMEIANSKNYTEIILVNDGTPDKSGEIAKAYAEKYNFLYVEKINGGLGDARNFGLKFASKEYVAFVDSDDKVANHFFDSIFQALEEQPDLLIFDWCDLFKDASRQEVAGMENEGNIWSVQPSAWNKVYKRSLFQKIQFPMGKVYEDVGTIYKLLSNVNKYIYLRKHLYLYRKGRPNSLLTTISPKINHIYDVLEETYQYYADVLDNNEQIKNGLCYQYIKLLMWSNMYRQLRYYKYNIWGFYKKMSETRQLLYKRFPNWKSCSMIEQNPSYFISRYGQNYINLIDKMGKNFTYTLYSLGIVLFKNFRRK